jgi:hypothetical protein
MFKPHSSIEHVRLESVQYVMADAEVGTMIEALLASCTKTTSGIPLEDLAADRALAGDAHAVGSMFKSIECGPQLIELRIALEGKERVNLVKIQASFVKEITRRIYSVVLLQVVEEL